MNLEYILNWCGFTDKRICVDATFFVVRWLRAWCSVKYMLIAYILWRTLFYTDGVTIYKYISKLNLKGVETVDGRVGGEFSAGTLLHFNIGVRVRAGPLLYTISSGNSCPCLSAIRCSSSIDECIIIHVDEDVLNTRV